MKKMLITFAAVLCCIMAVSAQDAQKDRNKVYGITFGQVEYTHRGEQPSATETVGQMLMGSSTSDASVEAPKYEGDVKNAIVKGLSSAYRYRFNDASKESGLIADVLIANITLKPDTRTWDDKDGNTQTSTTYRATIETTITFKDAKTGAVVANPTFKGQAMGGMYAEPAAAIGDANDRIATDITYWLNKNLPLQANILESATAKNDKQKEVYIDLGSREGAFAGLHLGVYTLKTVAGRDAKSQLGKLKIEAVEGDDISRCKVLGGGKEMKAALDAGEQLVAISIN